MSYLVIVWSSVHNDVGYQPIVWCYVPNGRATTLLYGIMCQMPWAIIPFYDIMGHYPIVWCYASNVGGPTQPYGALSPMPG